MIDLGEGLPALETPRLTLRGVTLDDVDALYAIYSDPEVMRYWSWPAWTHPDQARALVRSIEEGLERGDLLEWGVERRGERRLIGTVTLARWERPHRRAEIGFALARACWGQGLMKEAVAAAIRFGFEALELVRIEADVDPRNARSLALLTSLGFVREGYLRRRYIVAGEVQDAVLLGLLVDSRVA